MKRKESAEKVSAYNVDKKLKSTCVFFYGLVHNKYFVLEMGEDTSIFSRQFILDKQLM